jgi:tRNA A37 threonylcarbamoyladenosine dehydratase
MRRELKKRGVNHLKVVYSREPAMTPAVEVMDDNLGEETPGRRQVPGSTAFVPPAAGLIIAAEVVRDLTGVRGAETN